MANPEIKIQSWGLRTESLAPGDNIPIYLVIENFGFDSYKAEMMLRIEEDVYFNTSGMKVPVSEIRSLQKVKVDMELQVKALDNLEHLPKKKEIVLVTRKGTVANIWVAIPIEPFVNWLKTRPPVKCLLFGQIGSGKSSFINSVVTLYSNYGPFAKDVKNVAFSCAADSTVTKGLTAYSANNVPVFAGSNLTMLDTWGYEKRYPDRWSEFILEGLCKGRIPEQFDVVRAACFSVDNLTAAPNPALTPDVAVFALTPAAAQDAEYVAVMTTYINKAVACGLNPIILLTQVDNVDATLRENPYITNPVLDDIRSTVASRTRINLSDIIPVINYSQELERNWDMDRAAFVAVRHIFLRSELRVIPVGGRSAGSGSRR